MLITNTLLVNILKILLKWARFFAVKQLCFSFYHKISTSRWMLNHDPLQRPSSAELLQSELLPPPQFEECELQELLRRTINTPQSKLYKYLIDTCFKQVGIICLSFYLIILSSLIHILKYRGRNRLSVQYVTPLDQTVHLLCILNGWSA